MRDEDNPATLVRSSQLLLACVYVPAQTCRLDVVSMPCLKGDADHGWTRRKPAPTVQTDVLGKHLLSGQNVVRRADGRPHLAHAPRAARAPLAGQGAFNLLVDNEREWRGDAALAPVTLEHMDARVGRRLDLGGLGTRVRIRGNEGYCGGAGVRAGGRVLAPMVGRAATCCAWP